MRHYIQLRYSIRRMLIDIGLVIPEWCQSQIGPTIITTTKMTTTRMSSNGFEENKQTTDNNSKSCSKSLEEHCRKLVVAVLVASNNIHIPRR